MMVIVSATNLQSEIVKTIPLIKISIGSLNHRL